MDEIDDHFNSLFAYNLKWLKQDEMDQTGQILMFYEYYSGGFLKSNQLSPWVKIFFWPSVFATDFAKGWS